MSALTGEAMPVEKLEGGRKTGKQGDPQSPETRELLEQTNLLFMGSNIVSGTAKAAALGQGEWSDD